MRIELNDVTHRIETLEDGYGYKLIFSSNGNTVELCLSKIELESLGVSIVAKCPLVEPRLDLSSELDGVRHLFRPLMYTDNRSVQILLRELQSDDLVRTLWISCDQDLIERIYQNMSSRAATMLLDDLDVFVSRYGSPDSEKVSQRILEEGITSVRKVMDIYSRLQIEGCVI